MDDEVKTMIREAPGVYKRELDIIEANRIARLPYKKRAIGESAASALIGL
jgi:hypothetical protein